MWLEEATQEIQWDVGSGAVTGRSKDSLGQPNWVAHLLVCFGGKEHWLRLQYLRARAFDIGVWGAGIGKGSQEEL